MRLSGSVWMGLPRQIPPDLLCALRKLKRVIKVSGTNAGHQGGRQERGERQGQQLQGAQLETPRGNLMEGTDSAWERDRARQCASE